jgi:hypothetical protein
MSSPSATCPGTSPPKFTAKQVAAAVFAETSPSNVTVGSTFARCSYGKTKLTAANSRVADLVQLPCNATT